MTTLLAAWTWFVVLMAGVGALVILFIGGILVWAWRNPEAELGFGAAHGDPEGVELLRLRPD